MAYQETRYEYEYHIPVWVLAHAYVDYWTLEICDTTESRIPPCPTSLSAGF